MKRSASVFIVAVLLSHACVGQSITAVTPSNLDVGQGLEVTISCSNNGMFFCPQLTSWRICDTIKSVYFQQGNSILEPYAIAGTKDSSIVALMVFPLWCQAGAWDVVIEHKPSDTTFDTIQKMVKTGGFTLNPLSNPVLDSIWPATVYQNRSVAFDLSGRHTHFKFVQQNGSLVDNITAVRLTRNASVITADSVSIESCIKAKVYFTLKNSADTGLFALSIDQGNARPSVELQNAVAIKCVPSAPYSLPDGCIAFYPFEGNAVDRSYNGNNGTIHNASTVDGRFGQALYFNDRGSFVIVPHSFSLTAVSGLSISAWVKTEYARTEVDAGYSWNGIVHKGGYNNYWGLGIDMAGGGYFALYKTFLECNANYLHLNDWNHILGTWDGAVMRCYINGVLQPFTKEVVSPIPVMQLDPELIIGADIDGPRFEGIIDEVMIFNCGLNAAAVDSIYKGMYIKSVTSTTQQNPTVSSENFRDRISKTGALINYELAKVSPVSIKLYSLQGKLLKEMTFSRKLPGRHETSLGVSGLSRGYYLLDFKAGDFSRTKSIANF